MPLTVRVAYGASQKTTTLHRGEFSILCGRNPAAYEAAGLSYDTKFDLPFTTEWTAVSHVHGMSIYNRPS